MPARQRDRSRPPRALGGGAATLPDSLARVQVPFFEFFNDCSGADVQHPRGIANAARIQGHIHDLLLDGRRLTGVGILQEKRAPAPLKALPAAIALLALR